MQRAGRKGLPRLWRRLERLVYRPGDRIILTVTQPRHVAERAEVLIRAAKLPDVRLLRSLAPPGRYRDLRRAPWYGDAPARR